MLYKNNLIRKLFILFILYLNVIFTFTVIYLILDYSGLGPIVDHYRGYRQADDWFDPLIKPLYFSAITLLSVGYGDITPFGWSRVVAVIEAMIGYLLPATLVIQYVHSFRRIFERPRAKKDS